MNAEPDSAFWDEPGTDQIETTREDCGVPTEQVNPNPAIEPPESTSEQESEFSRKFGTCGGCNKVDVRIKKAEPMGWFCEDCWWDLEQQTPLGSEHEGEE